jgi:Tfp pilus assembly protein PilE
MRTDRRIAFTLIETLIVMGIIALITAIVFGAMAPAREKARESSCTSQMHQWSKAFAMYKTDYDGLDAIEGVAMTQSELGLPTMSSTVFAPMYKLESIRRCPSFRTSVSPLAGERLYLSYNPWGPFASPTDIDIKDTVKQRGPELAILLCRYHMTNPIPGHHPSWEPWRFNVLRLNGSVKMNSYASIPSTPSAF